MSCAPISILTTKKSRKEPATTASISTFWTCNGFFRRREVKELQRKVDADGPGATLLGFPDPCHRGVRQRLGGPLFSGRLIRIPPSSVSGSPAPLQVDRSPVTFLVTTLRWPPVRCAAGLVFLRGAENREGRLLVPIGGLATAPLGALKVLFCSQAHAGHFGSLVGDCNAIAGA